MSGMAILYFFKHNFFLKIKTLIDQYTILTGEFSRPDQDSVQLSQ